MSLLVGAIADDFTGATDLANTLVRSGMRTTQLIGVPDADTPLVDPASRDGSAPDAIVVALKIRTVPAYMAVAEAREALSWLTRHAARQIIWKYCSTFDSTDAGNIGPVADALRSDLGADVVVACPAFPATGRTIYRGHLFVGDRLLSESGMRNHPLTPMRDADLMRVLSRQVAGEVGRIDFSSVNSGAAAIRDALTELSRAGIAYAIPDVLEDTHLMHLGRALAGARLITGGSGIALGLAENFRAAGELGAPVPPALPDVDGGAAVIAGSCSEATREQVAVFAREHAAHQVEPTSDATASSLAEAALSFTRDVPSDAPLLIYSSAAPAAVAAVQSARGRDDAGALVEAALAKVAQGLVGQGRRRLVVAGGETSGAVTTALGIERLTIGPEIDPGVPWTLAEGRARNGDAGHTRIALALKSGNFGAPDFFSKALAMLP